MKLVKIALSLFTILLLVGCGNSKVEKLFIINWGEYMDPELIEKFEQEYNVRVVYEETESNEAMYTRIAMRASAYDIAIPSEYMISKMLKDDLLLPLDKASYTNYDNIDSEYFMLTTFDSNGEYFVPYFTGSIGIMYNKDLVDEKDLTGWDVLWNKKYSGKIYMYDSIRDSMSVGALKNGYSINTTNQRELDIIEKSLIEQKSLVRGYATDDIKNLIQAGDGALGVVYNGDYLVTHNELLENNQEINVGYYVPETGTNAWLDGMVIPSTSKNTEMANNFINFMLEEVNAYQNVTYVEYSTTNKAVYEKLLSEDNEFYSSTAYMLNQDVLNNSESYIDLGKDMNQVYSDIFTTIKNS